MPRVNIDLGPEVRTAYDDFVGVNNLIIRKMEARMAGSTSIVTRASGGTFDLFDLRDRMVAVDYKTRYAAVSLKNLENIYERQLGAAREGDLLGQRVPLTEDVAFNADVAFSFMSSSMDLASWVVHLAHGSTLTSKYVTLPKVCENLGALSGSQYDLFRSIRTEIESGWLAKFEGYRNYLTHHGRLQSGRGFRFAEGQVTVGVILLPDNPLARPPTYREDIELVPYGKDSMVKVLGMIESMYTFVDNLLWPS